MTPNEKARLSEIQKAKWADPVYREFMAKRRAGKLVGRPRIPFEKRVWKYVRKTDSCWLWLGALDRDGYGQTRIDGKAYKAHRAVYELMVGPIPEGLQIDHVKAKGCTNRACVNPDHLEPVVCRENIIRGDGPRVAGNRNAAKTECPKGHPYDEQNTRIDKDGRRHCKACHG